MRRNFPHRGPSPVRAVLLCLLFAAGAAFSAPSPADEPQKQWYKGNLHTHSLWSDGNDFPEMICDWYVRHGYDFLGLSDHNILSRGEKWIATDLAARRGAIKGFERYQARFGDTWVVTREQDGKQQVRLRALDEFRTQFEKPGQFLLIEAEEITDHFKGRPVHVNASNLGELIRPQGGESIRDTIANNVRAVQQQSKRLGRPILPHLNHPNFGYAVTAEDLAAVVEERYFEVYNGHPGVHHLGDAEHLSVERIWDVANTIRISRLRQPPLFGLATDDSHNYFGDRGASPGRGWVMVRAAKLDADTLIQAMLDGDFYASSGVTLEAVRFDRDGDELQVAIQADDGVEYETQFVGTLREDVDSDGSFDTKAAGRVLATVPGTRVTYKITGRELYVRAVVTSSRPHENPSYEQQRQQAWTQPVGWGRHLRSGAD